MNYESKFLTTPPPRDRRIWLRGNIVYTEGCESSAETWEGLAEWNEAGKCWVGTDKLSIAWEPDGFHVHEWMELRDRALNCPDGELSTSGAIYFWDEEWRREDGQAGYFACLSVWHSLSSIYFLSASEGPFESRNAAVHALTELLTSPIDTSKVVDR